MQGLEDTNQFETQQLDVDGLGTEQLGTEQGTVTQLYAKQLMEKKLKDLNENLQPDERPWQKDGGRTFLKLYTGFRVWCEFQKPYIKVWTVG